MAYTQTDLDALDAAIARSELSVQFGDRRIQYRSMDELLQARKHVAAQIASASGRKSHSRFTFSTARGD